MTNADICQFTAEQKLEVLGRLSPEGRSQTALVEIAATPEFEILFDTVQSPRIFRNLGSNPNCSFVMGWTGEVTLQCKGEAGHREGAGLALSQQVYFT